MFKNFIIQLYLSLYKIPYLVFILLIIFIVTLLILSLFTLLCILDATYRPNVKQYAYNLVLDRILPIIFIFSPTIIILWLNPIDFSFIEKFLIIILIHIFVLLPIMYIWSKNRNWLENNKLWSNPKIYLSLTIAMIYPAFFGFFLSFLRYIRLGNSINFYEIFNTYYNSSNILLVISIIILFWKVIIIWLLILYNFIYKIRHYLWSHVISLIHGLHIFLLRFKIYFKYIEIVYKISFIFLTYIIYHPVIYIKEPRNIIRKLLRKLYLQPVYIFITICITFFIELLFNKGVIFYSLYILFIYIILKTFIYCLTTFAKSEWAKDCCLADYTSYNWNNPKYPTAFWNQFSIMYKSFNNSPELSDAVYNSIQKNISKVQSNFRAKQRMHQNLLINNTKKSFNYRIKSSYMIWTQVRWGHTEVLHKATSFFARNLFEKISLINSPKGWQNHFAHIEQVEKRFKPVLSMEERDIYINFKPMQVNIKTIAQVCEYNLQTNFVSLKEKGVSFFTFGEKNLQLVSQNQARPDTIHDFQDSEFTFKGIVGMDQKSLQSLPNQTHCRIFSGMPDMVYCNALTNFVNEMVCNVELSALQFSQITTVISTMKLHCNDLDQLQNIWASNLHLFPKEFIPPLKIPDNFSLRDVKPSVLQKIEAANLKLKKISDYLYLRGIPQECNFKQATELFADSEIQRLMQS